jgi:hypothetical protein
LSDDAIGQTTTGDPIVLLVQADPSVVGLPDTLLSLTA